MKLAPLTDFRRGRCERRGRADHAPAVPWRRRRSRFDGKTSHRGPKQLLSPVVWCSPGRREGRRAMASETGSQVAKAEEDVRASADESFEGVTPDAARRLLLGAVEAFAERGFHATTTRDIAGRAGMSPAALYIHYKTKEELLFQISRVGHERSVSVLGRGRRGRRQRRGAAGARRTALRALARRAPHHRPRRAVRTGGARRGALRGDRGPAAAQRGDPARHPGERRRGRGVRGRRTSAARRSR